MNDQQMADAGILPGADPGPADLGRIRPAGWDQGGQAQVAPNIDDVDPGRLTIKPAPVPATPPGYVLDQISAGEGTADDNPNVKSHYPSGSGYDVVYGYAGTPKPASQMSLPEVRQQQDKMNGPTPVGRYQINKDTIDTESKKLGLNGTEIFSPDLQDRMARQLLVGHGWNDFMSGRITGPQFGQKLSPVWSSLQDPRKMAQFQKVLSQVPRGQ
jgi:muramidase (phage lysozyme)